MGRVLQNFDPAKKFVTAISSWS